MAEDRAELRTRDEFFNAITHALGVIFGIIFIPILILNAVNHAAPSIVAGTSLYGFSFLMVFTFSTLFHWRRPGKMKDTFRIIDHISIYFLIAGTYTPFILIFVDTAYGHGLLYVLWGLALAGTIYKIFFTGKFEIISTFIYVIMGWMLLTGADAFFAKMPYRVIALIIWGGCLYSIGVIFYLWRGLSYHHAVWHLLVLAAAICHYTAIFLAV